MEYTLTHPPSPQFLEAVRRTFPHIHTVEDFFTTPEDRAAQLIERIAKRHAEERTFPARYSTTTFDAADLEATHYVPHSHNTRWYSLAEAFELFSITHGVLFCAPFFWHIEPLVHHACGTVGVPISTVAPNNIPLAAEVVRQIGTEAVVGTPESIAALLDEWARRGIEHSVQLFVAIHAPQDEIGKQRKTLLRAPGMSTLLSEVHMFPGFPVLTQSLVLTKEHELFNLNQAYAWEMDTRTTRITGIADDALPACRYPLPFALQRTDHSSTCYALSAP